MHISISGRADTIDGIWFKIRRTSLLGPDGGGRSTKHAAAGRGTGSLYPRDGCFREMYTLMTEGEAEHVKYLDPDTMTRLRITTKEVVAVKMADHDFWPGHTSCCHPLPSMLSSSHCNGSLLLLLIPPNARSIPPAEYRYRGQNASEIWIDVQQDRGAVKTHCSENCSA